MIEEFILAYYTGEVGHLCKVGYLANGHFRKVFKVRKKSPKSPRKKNPRKEIVVN
jgi:hypothetical protein